MSTVKELFFSNHAEALHVLVRGNKDSQRLANVLQIRPSAVRKKTKKRPAATITTLKTTSTSASDSLNYQGITTLNLSLNIDTME